MFRPIILLIFSALAMTHAVVPFGTHFSANEKFSVELSLTPENEVLVSVFEHVKTGKTLEWSRPVEWDEAYPGSRPGSLTSSSMVEVKPLVTNDGGTVLLRDYNTPELKNGLKIVRRSGDIKTLNPFARLELTGALPEGRYPSPLRMGISYLHVGALLDFVLDDEKACAFWFGQTDRWVIISLQDFQETIVQDSATITHLNEIAHRKAEQLVLEHQPPPLRRMMSRVRQQLAHYFPSLAAPFYPRYMMAETSAAYLFLTARHYSADKPYVQNLIQHGPEGTQQGFVNQPGLNVTYSVGWSERLIGDYLLARWNGETNHFDIIPKDTYLLLPHDFAKYLGAIAVDFQLPRTVPATNCGDLWAYLIPARLAQAVWTNSDEVIAFRTRPRLPGPEPSETLGPDGRAAFRELTPGEYCVKLIWERNPAGGVWSTNRYFPVSGDYESPVSASITVKPGETAKANLACTNRIGLATAYAEDDQWIADHHFSRP